MISKRLTSISLVLVIAAAYPAAASVPSRARLAPPPATVAPAGAAEALAGLPLAFEPAPGDAARFVARGAGHAVTVSGDAATFFGAEGTIRMRFGRAASVAAEAKLPGVSNYIVGNDPAAWRTGVETFARVRCAEVAPGVDIVFYGTQSAVEHDFVVAPGADPLSIEVTFEGAERLRVDEGGDLVIETARGEVRQPSPVIYQETAAGRRRVSGGYRLMGVRVGFRIGAYDPALPLVVDPVLRYSTFYGGSGDDRVEDAAVDANGNFVVAGSTLSTNLPLVANLQGNESGMDGFVAKINAAGTALLFSTYVGGNDTDNFNAVALDASGRIFLAGSSSSGDYPTVNAYDNSPNGLDAMLTVLSSVGGGPIYATFIGGGNNDIGEAVAVDVNGNAFLAGETLEAGFLTRNFPTKSPSSLPPFQDDYGGGRSDAFVCKFDPDESGNTSLVYSTLIGGSEGEGVLDVAVDELERAYVCGYTESSNFPRLNAIENTYGGSTSDGFVAKLNADGTTLFYSTFFGGSGIEEARGIALDTSGGVIRPVVTGNTTSTNINLQLPIQGSKNGPEDMFVCKLNETGTQYVFSTYFGGPSNDAGHDVVVDDAGNAFLTGNSVQAYPLLNPVPINGATVQSGVFVTKLSASGALLRSTCVGPGVGSAIDLDPVGNVLVAGLTSVSTFPTTPGAPQTTHAGINDGFAFKLDFVDDDTIGVFKPGTRQFQLRDENLAGAADVTVTFGVAGDKPIVGDWDGDGDTTIGVYTPSTGTFSLRNANTPGAANITFTFGAPNLVPIAGDWNGDGVDTVGIFDPATGSYFLTNSTTGGTADFVFTFGAGGAGVTALAGDWNGDGVDTIGFYVASSRTYFLRNQNAGGNADLQFVFGPSAATPVAGDWDGDGVDTIGAFARASFLPSLLGMRFSLRNSNTAGAADITVSFGVSGDLPVTGNWDGN